MWSTDLNCFHLLLKLMLTPSSSLLDCSSSAVRSFRYRPLQRRAGERSDTRVACMLHATADDTETLDKCILTCRGCREAWSVGKLVCSSWMILCSRLVILVLPDPTLEGGMVRTNKLHVQVQGNGNHSLVMRIWQSTDRHHNNKLNTYSYYWWDEWGNPHFISFIALNQCTQNMFFYSTLCSLWKKTLLLKALWPDKILPNTRSSAILVATQSHTHTLPCKSPSNNPVPLALCLTNPIERQDHFQ